MSEQHYPEVTYTAYIRQNATGKIVEYHDSLEPWDDDGGFGALDFMYGLGNYSCDCNRELFWHYAQGIDPDNFDEVECGNNKYDVKIVLDADGTVVFDEIS